MSRPLALRAGPSRRRRVAEWVSAYLPLLLMLLLALATWWLVKHTPLPEVPAASAPLRHEPDYEMRKFTVQRFTALGQLRAQIEGEALRHYPDTDTLEIDDLRLRAIGVDGRITRANARHAVANGAGTEVQLLGGAEVVSEAAQGGDAITFRGEFLQAFLDTERVISLASVTVEHGAAELRADSMEYSHLDRVIRFGAHLRASFTPPGRP